MPEVLVAPAAVVEDLDELEDRHSQRVAGRPGMPIEQLGLQGREEALGDGVGVQRRLLLFATVMRELFGSRIRSILCRVVSSRSSPAA